jgi:opacity protein-like surface antigen
MDEARPYFTLGGGASKMQGAGITDTTTPGATRISVEPGFNAMIATGLAWDVGRLEFSGGVLYEKLDQININGNWTDTDGNITMYNLMLSVFYDFNKDGMISPYFGGGVGAARMDLTSSDLSGNDAFTFAYQLGAGLTLNTSDSFVIDLGYRLLGTNKINFGGTTTDAFVFQNANVGLRWLF